MPTTCLRHRHGHNKGLQLTLLLLLLGVTSSPADAEDVTNQVFSRGQNENVYPVALGDYNSDKFTDMVLLSNDSSTFDIYFGSNTPPYLYRKSSFHKCHLTFQPDGHGAPKQVAITGITLADFTGDAVSDICVSFKVLSDPSRYDHVTFVQIFKGTLGEEEFNCENGAAAAATLTLNSSNSSPYLQLRDEPLIVDMNGDTVADLFGVAAADGQKYFWIFDNGRPEQYKLSCEGCGGGDGPSILKMNFPSPHVNSFVDLDGDFSPELVLILQDDEHNEPTTYLLILSIEHVDPYKRTVKLRSIQEEPLSLGSPKDPVHRIGNPIPLDLNLRGELNLLIPVCHDKKCKRTDFLLYEHQPPGSGGSGAAGAAAATLTKLGIKFTDEQGRPFTFLTKEVDPIYGKSINFYVGDYNLDGYPDLIGTLIQGQASSSQAEKRGIFFKNEACHGHGKECSSTPRTLVPDFNFLQDYSDSRSAFFFDVQEDGLLDIMIVGGSGSSGASSSGKSSNRKTQISVHKNVPEYDAYFIKWIITTAPCQSQSGGGAESATACPLYNGVRAPGASMSYSTTDLNIRLQTSRGAQLLRPGFALDFPYIVMGTGTTANFIETVKFGTTSSTVHTKTQIIPNSILIATPPSPSGYYSTRWQVKQLISPSFIGATQTLRVLLAICAVIGTVIFVLWLKERRQDKLYNEQQKDRSLNFSLSPIAFA